MSEVMDMKSAKIKVKDEWSCEYVMIDKSMKDRKLKKYNDL